MMHVVFERPTQSLKIFLPDGLDYELIASGDAWGSGYGHDAPIAPGHYLFTGQIDYFEPPIASEGPGQIYVSDVNDRHLGWLIAAKRARMAGQQVDVGGIVLPDRRTRSLRSRRDHGTRWRQ